MLRPTALLSLVVLCAVAAGQPPAPQPAPMPVPMPVSNRVIITGPAGGAELPGAAGITVTGLYDNIRGNAESIQLLISDVTNPNNPNPPANGGTAVVRANSSGELVYANTGPLPAGTYRFMLVMSDSAVGPIIDAVTVTVK